MATGQTTTCNGCGRLVPFLGAGSECPCECHRRQPLTGSTMAQDNDPVLVRQGGKWEPNRDKGRALALRSIAESIAEVFPLEANGLCNLADELDPAGKAKPEDQGGF